MQVAAANTSTARPRSIASLARVVAPFVLGGAIALAPVPDGLAPAAWYYFALFVTVITLIITEPIPAAVVLMIGRSA